MSDSSERKSTSAISNNDILKVSITIIAFIFTTVGFLANARGQGSITEIEFNSLLESLVVVIFLFSIPTLLLILLDILPENFFGFNLFENLNISFDMIKIPFFFSFLSIPWVFYNIVTAFNVKLSQESMIVILVFSVFSVSLVVISLLWGIPIFKLTSEKKIRRISYNFLLPLVSVIIILVLLIFTLPTILEIVITPISNISIDFATFLTLSMVILSAITLTLQSPTRKRGTAIFIQKNRRWSLFFSVTLLFFWLITILLYK